MLKVITRLDQLDIGQIISLYYETNLKYGADRYGHLHENLQLLYAEQDLYAYIEMFLADDDTAYAVWAPGEAYKAALRIERYSDGLIITGLETAPGERQKGFATELLSSVVQFLTDHYSGKVYSHIEKTNYASLKLHQNIGFTVISNTATYIDGSFHNDAYTYCLEI